LHVHQTVFSYPQPDGGSLNAEMYSQLGVTPLKVQAVFDGY